MDSLFLTLSSTVACIVLPKFLSTIFSRNSKQVELASKTPVQQGNPEVPSFPY
jgi:hypothetical protein